MRGRALRTGLAIAFGLSAGGCYSGLFDGPEQLPPRAPGASGDDDDDGASRDDAGDDGADDGDGEPQGECATPNAGVQPLRRLTRIQYTNTIADLLGVDTDVAEVFPLDERVGAFESNAIVPVSDLVVEQYMDAAEDLAIEAIDTNPSLLGCDPAVMGEDACAEQFIADIGRKIHRRPLTADELSSYVGLFEHGRDEVDFDNGIRLALQTMLQSPYFLYHVELGAGADDIVALTDYELASRLSYYLWASMPDDELLDLAEAGMLSDPEVLQQQAERLLADPKSEQVIASFHLQWLAIDDMSATEKDTELYPQYSEALEVAMQQDAAKFASHVIRENGAKLETLLTASYTMSTDPELLALYGVELPVGHVEGDPIPLDPTQRAGLVTSPALMAHAAHVEQSSPVHRGVIVRQNFLCQPLPPPPPDVDDTPPEPDPNATTRERFAEHTSNPECAGCHSMIDGLGFGFEHYDAIGAWRTHEGELPVDASGTVIGTQEINGDFDGAVELAGLLATAVEVKQCVAQQWFNYALGRLPAPQDSCSTDLMYQQFEASEFDIRVLMMSVVTSDSFRHVRIAEEEGA